MKRNILFVVMFAILAIAGCNRNVKTTENDAKKAEEALFNADQTLNAEAVSNAVETFDKFATDNPEDAKAPEYLFKALEVSVNTKQAPQKSIDLANRLIANYPEFDKNPVALFMLATFVYDEQLHDLDKARDTYQQIIDNYPGNPFAKDAEISIKQLGMTPDELIKMFEEAEN